MRDEDPDPDVSCGFCGKSRRRVAAMAAAGEARICDECLSLCDEI
ncbi:MAG TPA: ClpX C4-type zinc finger protein [Streptosporangiaceae bacterium]